MPDRQRIQHKIAESVLLVSLFEKRYVNETVVGVLKSGYTRHDPIMRVRVECGAARMINTVLFNGSR